jgi:serine/threonine protein kinase
VHSAVGDESYLVTPYVGTDLTGLPHVEEPRALLELFRGVVVAVRDAHAKGIVHRDIKPNNVVVDDQGTPFLVDFGICADDEDDVMLTTVEAFGNRAFAAPECEAGSEEECGLPSDIYSLGKLLYWMASAGKFLPQQNFNRDNLTIADRHAAQYISVLITHTVRESPGSRWSVSELLERIDWILLKLDEHSAVRDAGSIVLDDGFGPRDTCNEGSFQSATRGRGNPPADYEFAQSFFVSEVVVLERLDIGLKLRYGSGRVRVTLISGDFEAPSEEPESVVEQWDREITSPTGALVVLHLVSKSDKTLEPQEVHWVVLSARDESSDIAWMGAAIELVPRMSRAAERARPNEWELRMPESGPGMSLRVLARHI